MAFTSAVTTTGGGGEPVRLITTESDEVAVPLLLQTKVIVIGLLAVG